MNLRDNIPNLHELATDVQKLFDVINEAPFEIAVIVSGSYLDQIMGAILKKHFRDSSVTKKMLNSNRGILGSYAARSDLLYVLELTDKSTYTDLLTIGELRNLIAHHHLDIGTIHDQIKEKCNNLKHVESLGDTFKELMENASSAGRFAQTVAMLTSQLIVNHLQET